MNGVLEFGTEEMPRHRSADVEDVDPQKKAFTAIAASEPPQPLSCEIHLQISGVSRHEIAERCGAT